LSTQSAEAVTLHEETTDLPLAYRFVPGQRLVFKLDYRNNSNADFRRLFEDVPSRGQEQQQMSPMAYAFDISVQGNLTATVVEDDQSGQIQAQYQAEAKQGERKNKGGSATFRKTRLRYLTIPQKAKPNEIPVRQSITPGGSLMATFDLAGGHLSILTGSLSEATVIGGKEVARAESRINLSHT